MKRIFASMLAVLSLLALLASCAPAEYRVFEKEIKKKGEMQNEVLILDLGNGSDVYQRDNALVFFRTASLSDLTVNVNLILEAGDVKKGEYAWEGRVLYNGTVYTVKGVLTAKDVNEHTVVLPYDKVSDLAPGDFMTEKRITQSASAEVITLLSDMDAYLKAAKKTQTLADYGFTDFYVD